jgi:hypothetical protein
MTARRFWAAVACLLWLTGMVCAVAIIEAVR